MIILGINAFHGDASAAIVVDGKLVAAAEEERFSRIKHTAGFPHRAVAYCLSAAGVTAREVDHIALARDPKARLAKKLLWAARIPRLAFNRFGAWKKFATIQDELADGLDIDPATIRAQVHRIEHHQAHLASAFFVSPFDGAALLSIDGLGDFASTMSGTGRGNKLSIDHAVTFPHSLGIFYTALTQYLGFWKYGDEYKVMGLGAYGEAAYREEFAKLVRFNGAASFTLGLEYFDHHKSGPEMTWGEGEPVLGKLFGAKLEQLLGPVRARTDNLEQRHYNVAASLQARLEAAVLHLAAYLQRQTGSKNLCLAGGVAYNCLANSRILRETPFESIYIQPAAGDAGLAVGAAFYVWHQVLGKPRGFEMNHAYWGPKFSHQEIAAAIENKNLDIEHEITELPSPARNAKAAGAIARGKIVGWFQGRMEWGPRALGNRSILVDSRNPEMKEILNRRIKHREGFRPFAPSILAERTADYFEQSHLSPFMLMAYKVKADKRAAIPAPTHVDGTGRLQTVTREANGDYWELLHEFEKLTGVPVLLNTSFNDNEPVVCRPDEAIECFRRTKMDLLVLGNHVIEKRPAAASES